MVCRGKWVRIPPGLPCPLRPNERLVMLLCNHSRCHCNIFLLLTNVYMYIYISLIMMYIFFILCRVNIYQRHSQTCFRQTVCMIINDFPEQKMQRTSSFVELLILMASLHLSQGIRSTLTFEIKGNVGVRVTEWVEGVAPPLAAIFNHRTHDGD